MAMKGLEYRDNRMKCELFYLENPEFANEPWNHVDPEIHVVCQFRAVNFKDAIEYTKNYNLNHSDHRYFWRHKHERGDYGLWHEDGVCSWGLSDIDNYFVDKVAALRKQLRELDRELKSTEQDTLHHRVLRNRRIQVLRKIGKVRRLSTNKFIRFLVKSGIAISDWCSWWFKDFWVEKFKDWKWKREKISTWKKTGHSPDEWWSLELHLLDTLKFNLKKLIKDGMGINSVFIEDVLRKRHANDLDFDLDKEFIRFHMGEDTGVEDEAVELQKQTYDRICHLVDLYTFYYNSEVDEKDIYEHPELRTDDMREIYVDETYDMVDYLTMSKKGRECWNEIWDLVKKYGQQMGD